MDVEKEFENNSENNQTSGERLKVPGTIDWPKYMNQSADGLRDGKTPEEFV